MSYKLGELPRADLFFAHKGLFLAREFDSCPGGEMCFLSRGQAFVSAREDLLLDPGGFIVCLDFESCPGRFVFAQEDLF